MAQPDTASRNQPPMADPLDFAGAEAFSQQGVKSGMAPAVLPASQGELTVNIFGGVVTAQKVAIKRDIGDVLKRMFALAGVMGMDYVYRIPYRAKVKGPDGKDVQPPKWETVYVEGPTIVLANDLAREWGNCNVETRFFDRGTYWEMYARFVDYETGYSLTRPFLQRKQQDTGMKDDGRRLDMVFQIGASKAQRNVVVNVLQGITAKIVAEAKKGLRARVDAKPAEARAWIMEQLKKHSIELRLVEHSYGRAHAHWTTDDLTQIYMEVKSIDEGLASADDIWGPPAEAAETKGTPNTNRLNFTLVTTEGEVIGDGEGKIPEPGGTVLFKGESYTVDAVQPDADPLSMHATLVVRKPEGPAGDRGADPKPELPQAEAKAPAVKKDQKRLFGKKD